MTSDLNNIDTLQKKLEELQAEYAAAQEECDYVLAAIIEQEIDLCQEDITKMKAIWNDGETVK